MAEDDTAAQFRKNARPPPPFTLGEDKCENWKRFKQRWNNFCLISNFSKIDRAIQVAQLENCLADDALKVLDGFHFNTPAEQRTTKEIIDAFDNYVIGQTNETLERYRFGTRKQEEGEPFNNFWLIFAVSSKPVTIVKIASNLSFETDLSLESTAMTQERIC